METTTEIKLEVQPAQAQPKPLKIEDLEIEILPTIYEIIRW